MALDRPSPEAFGATLFGNLLSKWTQRYETGQAQQREDVLTAEERARQDELIAQQKAREDELIQQKYDREDLLRSLEEKKEKKGRLRGRLAGIEEESKEERKIEEDQRRAVEAFRTQKDIELEFDIKKAKAFTELGVDPRTGRPLEGEGPDYRRAQLLWRDYNTQAIGGRMMPRVTNPKVSKDAIIRLAKEGEENLPDIFEEAVAKQEVHAILYESQSSNARNLQRIVRDMKLPTTSGVFEGIDVILAAEQFVPGFLERLNFNVDPEAEYSIYSLVRAVMDESGGAASREELERLLYQLLSMEQAPPDAEKKMAEKTGMDQFEARKMLDPYKETYGKAFGKAYSGIKKWVVGGEEDKVAGE